MVLIICTKNELNLTNRYSDMVPDGRTEWTDGQRQNYIPPTSSGNNKHRGQTSNSSFNYLFLLTLSLPNFWGNVLLSAKYILGYVTTEGQAV